MASQIELDLMEEFEKTAPSADELQEKIKEYNNENEKNESTNETTETGDTNEKENEPRRTSTDGDNESSENNETDGKERDSNDKESKTDDTKRVAENENQDSTETEQVQEQETQAELILGKFKTVEDLQNAYTNLEKLVSKKSQQVAEARAISNPSDFEKSVNEAISKASWDLTYKAIGTIQDVDQAKEATFALEQYRRTGDQQFLEKARGFLDPRVDRALERDFYNTTAAIRQEANQYRDEIELAPIKESLEELAKTESDWLSVPCNQSIMAEAIKLNRHVNVKQVADLIKESNRQAVERYKAQEAKKAVKVAEKKAPVSIKADTRPEPPAPKKDWRTMSIEDQLREEMKDFGLK